jgi:hypothetical protein
VSSLGVALAAGGFTVLGVLVTVGGNLLGNRAQAASQERLAALAHAADNVRTLRSERREVYPRCVQAYTAWANEIVRLREDVVHGRRPQATHQTLIAYIGPALDAAEYSKLEVLLICNDEVAKAIGAMDRYLSKCLSKAAMGKREEYKELTPLRDGLIEAMHRELETNAPPSP